VIDARGCPPANPRPTFPNTGEAGLEAGQGIVADCKADPHGLLFASVDFELEVGSLSTWRPALAGPPRSA
jgi:hypothetical protein